MKKRLLRLIFILPLAFFMSCGGDDPLPEPVPSFSATTALEVLEIGRSIQFINNSINASSYEWDFGDGVTSTLISPTYTYEIPGDYTVTLTAFSDDEQVIMAANDIYVGQRYLIEIDINSISFDNFDQDGNPVPWDVDSGPDVSVLFGPENDTAFEETIFAGPAPDVSSPFLGLALGPIDNYPLNNEDYVFALLDDDTSAGDPNAFELMIESPPLNPILAANSIVNPESGEGIFQLTGAGFDIVFVFEIK
ncbi:MAG: PKD domain-containing protein [Bacteroidetes bacterium]|nr:PKD domain-containing protein [Bacteroidota bacterium]MDA1120001.1 PKD domain-containing protein [Bacteroidota bacterium]